MKEENMKALVTEAKRILELCNGEDKLVSDVGIPASSLGLCQYLQDFMPEDNCSYRLFCTYKSSIPFDSYRLDLALYYNNVPITEWFPYNDYYGLESDTQMVKHLTGFGFPVKRAKDNITLLSFYENGEYLNTYKEITVEDFIFTCVSPYERELHIGPQRRAYLEWIRKNYDC